MPSARADAPDQICLDMKSSCQIPLPSPQIGLDSVSKVGNDRREENAPSISVPPTSSLPEIITFPSLYSLFLRTHLSSSPSSESEGSLAATFGAFPFQ